MSDKTMMMLDAIVVTSVAAIVIKLIWLYAIYVVN